jgi:transcriptional regulator with XRE-family HTH domain
MDTKYIFSENLKKLMDDKGISRRDLADTLGLNYFTISDWVNGRKYPRMDKVQILANYFGVLISDLVGDNFPSDISEKIKELRLSKGMTLEEVGDIVGVGKSTVRKWETGAISDMKRDKIPLLAEALSTTPAYLLGWFEHEPIENNIKITEDEQKLLDLFRRVPEDKQQMLIQMIQVALGNQ